MPPAAFLDEISAYDYELPNELIAQRPAEPRDHSRLMILHRCSGAIEHKRFYDIVDYLRAGDLLVLNNTKVLPLRIRGTRSTGGMVEALLVREVRSGVWEAFLKARGRLKEGETLEFENGRIKATLAFRTEEGGWALDLQHTTNLRDQLEEVGRAPLPPYVRRPPEMDDQLRECDRRWYQTVYASSPGAVAAPTAGLHFTPKLLGMIREKGIRATALTLHVGPGTFRPIKTALVSEHKMEAESFAFPPESAEMINRTRREGGRIVAVGSTCCRVLETVARMGPVLPASGWADLYIRAPFNFRLVDALITNFHLPKSTLLVLVCAFAGQDNIIRAYRKAIAMGYRFYSYGDAMLIRA